MDIDSRDISGGTLRDLGTVRRCICHFLEENKTTNYSDDGIVLSGGKGDTSLRCSACVQNLLQSSLQRHSQALQDHAAAKENCQRELDKIPMHHVPTLKAASQHLRDKSTILRKECADMAVKVAQAALQNETMREKIALNSSPLECQRIELQHLERGLLDESLTRAIDTATNQARFLRFQWARKVFAMYRLQIDSEDIKLTPLQKRRQESQPGQQLQRRARGIAKISGLPLPNAGPELYGVLPPRELQSVLRIVATVTSMVARCLGIILPHRILLTFNSSTSSVEDITKTISDEDLEQCTFTREERMSTVFENAANRHHNSSFSNRSNERMNATKGDRCDALRNYSHSSVISSSTNSLYSMMDKSYFYNKAKKALAKATAHYATPTNNNGNNTVLRSETPINNTKNKTIERSFDATIVAQRLSHVTAAILTDVDTAVDNSVSSRFALSSKALNQGDDFAVALQLLQNNIITLCIRTGVPVSKLWPAEAMLLNLHELEKFCQRQTSVEY